MNDIPEDFSWDGIILSLQCEKEHLTKELLPLSVSELDKAIDNLKIFPAIVKKNISYYQRLEFEKNIEHLPIKILWMPTTNYMLVHFFNACKSLRLESSIFKIGKEKEIDKKIVMDEFKRNSKFYEIFDRLEVSLDFPHVHGYQKVLEEQTVLQRFELESLLGLIDQSLKSLLRKTIDDSVHLHACGIQFINIDASVPLNEDDVVNLTSAHFFTEDFHLILPDSLVRIFYSKLIDASLQETRIRLNPQVYLQEIFRMSDFFYMTMNNWCLLHQIDAPFMVNYETSLCHFSDRSNSLSVENKASGAGFLIQWRFSMKQVPSQKMSTFFSLEILENMLKTAEKSL